MSYQVADCLLAGVPASKQSTNPYDIYLILCVQSWTPDDGRKDRPKHVVWHSINSKIVHLVGFSIEICTVPWTSNSNFYVVITTAPYRTLSRASLIQFTVHVFFYDLFGINFLFSHLNSEYRFSSPGVKRSASEVNL